MSFIFTLWFLVFLSRHPSTSGFFFFTFSSYLHSSVLSFSSSFLSLHYTLQRRLLFLNFLFLMFYLLLRLHFLWVFSSLYFRPNGLLLPLTLSSFLLPIRNHLFIFCSPLSVIFLYFFTCFFFFFLRIFFLS